MAEQVQTGGVMAFHYDLRDRPQLNVSEKREFADAYNRAMERKRREKKKKMIIWVLLLLALLLFLIIWLFVWGN